MINLLNIPVVVLETITVRIVISNSTSNTQMLLVSLSSNYFNDRSYHGILCQLWVLPLLIVEYLRADVLSPWAQYAVVLLILTQPFCESPSLISPVMSAEPGRSVHAAQIGWTSQIAHSVRTRTISAATYNTIVQIGNIISAK